MGSDAALDRTQRAMADLFIAPRPAVSSAAVVLLGLAAGALLVSEVGSARAPPGALVADAFGFGLLLVAVPGLLAGAGGYFWHARTGGRAYLRRTMLLSVATAALTVLTLLVWRLTVAWHDVPAAHALLLGAAVPLWLRVQAVAATAQPDRARALPDVVSHYALTLVALPVLAGAGGLPAGTWTLAVVLGALFLLAGAAVVEGMRHIGREDFDADLIALNEAVLAHITEGGGDAGRDVLEAFFDTESCAAAVHAGAVTFHDPDTRQLRLVLPVSGLHPGPFGTLSGSDLPRRLAEALHPVPVVTLHGACTHDQNPATSEETARVVRELADIARRAEPKGGARRPVRLDRRVLAHPLGPGVLLVHAPAPDRFDDVDPATGLLAEDAARDAGAPTALFADAHHAAEPGTLSIRYPSPRAHEVVEAAGEATAKALAQPVEPLRVGLAGRAGFTLADGLGPMGVQVVALAAGDHVTCYAVFDGNNMVPGARKTIRDAVLAVPGVAEAEVLTTDNHVVNAGLKGYNPVGHAVPADRWTPVARELAEQAVADLRPATCGMVRAIVTCRIFGAGTAERIGTLINLSTAATRRLMRVTLAGSLTAGAALTLLWSEFGGVPGLV